MSILESFSILHFMPLLELVSYGITAPWVLWSFHVLKNWRKMTSMLLMTVFIWMKMLWRNGSMRTTIHLFLYLGFLHIIRRYSKLASSACLSNSFRRKSSQCYYSCDHFLCVYNAQIQVRQHLISTISFHKHYKSIDPWYISIKLNAQATLL